MRHWSWQSDTHLNKALAADAHTAAKVVGPGKMAVQGRGIKLCHDVDLADAAVDAVAHRDIDEPVGTANGYSWLGALLGEGIQARSSTTTKDYSSYTLGVDGNLAALRGLGRLLNNCVHLQMSKDRTRTGYSAPLQTSSLGQATQSENRSVPNV